MDITQRMLRERAKDRTKTEAEELAELAALGINHPARRRHRERERIKKEQRLERGWNGSISRSRPPNLYGLKCATKEPWAGQATFPQSVRSPSSSGVTMNAPPPRL